jgi:hypothetical protein
METASASADECTPKMFLHARFEVPRASGGDEDGCNHSGQNSTESSLDINDQYFDATNCNSAVIGLPNGAEPIKVCCS